MIAVRAFHGRPSFTDQEASSSCRAGGRLRIGGGRLKPPALLAEIADVAGIEAARSVARARGGTETYFPSPGTIQGGAARGWSRLLGKRRRSRSRLSFRWGCCIYVPLWAEASRRIEVLDLTRAGRTVDEIARLIGCSNRTVYRVRKGLKKEGLL